jgi:hypothetical protein
MTTIKRFEGKPDETHVQLTEKGKIGHKLVKSRILTIAEADTEIAEGERKR